MARHTISEMMDYIKHWYDYDTYRNLNLAIDRGLDCIAVDLIVNSGAIDPDYCYDEYKSIEAAIMRRYGKISNKMLENEYNNDFFRSIEIWINPETNTHAFLDTAGYCGVDAEEMIDWGYKFDSGYDDQGNEYKQTKLD
jgi:hypothetical protein